MSVLKRSIVRRIKMSSVLYVVESWSKGLNASRNVIASPDYPITFWLTFDGVASL